MRRYCHFVSGKLLFGLLLLLGLQPAYAGEMRLALVLSEQGGAYQEYSKALAVQLAGKNMTLTVSDADNPVPEADLLIAAGMKACLSVARARPAAMLAVLVPKEGIGKVTGEFPALVKAGTNAFTAIYLDQPMRRQLELIAALLPKARSIGVLYSQAPKELGALRTLAAARKFELNERTAASFATLHTTLQELLLSSDVLLALPDAEIYNASTIRNILLATYRNRVPLIGFSPAYVKAGALGAVYSTPEQIAEQSLAVIQQYAEARALPSAQHARQFEVSLNEQVARSLGLTIRSAAEVRSELGAAP